ncbi:MAG: MiaB/RimO family radical SAM methylthiotransferase, partial [Deltaproteobacteria bacterium]|nr:MiaB/RimO family radical SAM methylthiotransferase [Deltaproteobacteria bacterium]
MKPGYLIATLGCRTNQFESARLSQDLEELGFEEAGPDRPRVEVALVNTCTVTHRADKESRQLIRRLARDHPGAKIVVTGCLAQLEGQSLMDLPGVSLVLGHPEQARFKEMMTRNLTGLWVGALAGRFETTFRTFGRLTGRLRPSPHRTRALLKVQDGCSKACAYCRVRLARGPSRSLAPDQVLAGVRDLTRAGHQEVVLTGIHLGGYGRDLRPKLGLADLVQAILDLKAGPRLRLSSLDPNQVSPELLKAAQASDRFCPHFHLALQSGDPEVLKRMNRPYSPRHFKDQVAAITSGLAQAAVGADVMAGFPGEDRAAFERTYALIESL